MMQTGWYLQTPRYHGSGLLNEHELAERFVALWNRCAGANARPEPVWHMLQQRYQEPHRHYHTLAHLSHCLGAMDTGNGQIVEADATEMAIWFHDVIYEYGAKNNEDLSAVTFRELAEPHMAADFIDRVCELIDATKHTGNAPDRGAAYMVDIDLSGFGLPWEGYLADSDALRLEAPDVSDERYYQGKLRFLNGLQQWPCLFQTEFFRDRLESTAQANISRYSADLRAQGFGE
jgi:predicted metal-dependent HD superfamily phosphohydrolase